MNTVEKLQADIEMDADLSLEEQLASLKSDAMTLARRMDKIIDWAKANEESYPLGTWIIAIAEGKDG